MDPREASFADQVLQSLRIKLRDQVVTHAPDPALLEALAKRNENKSEGQKVFHPGAAKAMKLRQATLCDPIEPPQVDPAKIEEAVTLTTEVLGEMQSGALSVADKEALGAKVLRQLDMEHYKECLKRSYLDGPGASILQAQTSIEKAREQNLAQQARGQKMAAALHLIPEPRSFWSDRARAAFEQNVFAPEYAGSLLASSRGTLVFFHDFVCVCFLFFLMFFVCVLLYMFPCFCLLFVFYCCVVSVFVCVFLFCLLFFVSLCFSMFPCVFLLFLYFSLLSVFVLLVVFLVFL